MKKLLPKSVNNPKGFTFRRKANDPQSGGFTLVELMVVISIIAILSVIGITIYSSIQKSARDARRKADIDSIAIAMEARFGSVTAGKYAPIAESFFSGNALPVDPINSSSTTACNGTRCEYCARSDSSILPSPTLCTGLWNGDLKANLALNLGGGTYPDQLWTVCTNLEIDNSGPGGVDYYCKQSQQ